MWCRLTVLVFCLLLLHVSGSNIKTSSIKRKMIHQRTLSTLKTSMLSRAKWEGVEHKYLGDHAYGLMAGVSSVDSLPRMVTENRLLLSFGDMVALAGDFFAGDTVDDSISQPTNTDSEDLIRVGRGLREFNKMFDLYLRSKSNLANTALAREFLKRINGDMKVVSETEDLARGATNEEPSKWSKPFGTLRDALSTEFDDVDHIIMNLAVTNVDHFQDHLPGRTPSSILAYEIAHQQAYTWAMEANTLLTAINPPPHQSDIDQVMTAFKGGDDSVTSNPIYKWKRKFTDAWLAEAWALHFLTDSFAAGHIRAPRIIVLNCEDGKKFGGLMTKTMHDEDNDKGVVVENALGKKWTAYGDKHLFTRDDSEDYANCMAAMKVSLLEVLAATKNADVPVKAPYKVRDHYPVALPYPCDTPPCENNPPLFYVNEDQQLMHRTSGPLYQPATYETVDVTETGACSACTVTVTVNAAVGG